MLSALYESPAVAETLIRIIQDETVDEEAEVGGVTAPCQRYGTYHHYFI